MSPRKSSNTDAAVELMRIPFGFADNIGVKGFVRQVNNPRKQGLEAINYREFSER